MRPNLARPDSEEYRSVFVFFSNPHAFESVLLEPLGELERTSTLRFFGCLLVPDSNASDRLGRKIQEAGLDLARWDFITASGHSRIFTKAISFPATLLAEFRYWSARPEELAGSRWEGIIVHSESFLSDHVALSLGATESKKLLVNPLNDLVENHQSVPNIFVTRLRQIWQSLGARNAGAPSVMANGIANLIYRLSMPIVFRYLTKKRLERKLVARRFVGGGNCHTYVVGIQAARRILTLFPGQDVITIRQVRERSVTREGFLKGSIVLLSEVPSQKNQQNRYIEALAKDLVEAGKIVPLEEPLIVRPHPSHIAEGEAVCLALARLGFETVLASTDEDLSSQLIARRVVLGTWSSALYQALGFVTGGTVIGLLSASLVANPDLVIEEAPGLKWVSGGSAKKKRLHSDNFFSRNNPMVAPPVRASRMSEVIDEFFAV